MKKLFAVILITFLSSIFAFSQTETPKSADWQNFAPTEEEFSIDIPISLNVSTFLNVDPKNISRRYINSIDGTFFYIFSDDSKKPIQFDFVSAFANLNQKSVISKNSDELEVEKYEFADKEDFYHTILAVRGKSRFYVFQTTSPTKDNSLVERFFATLKLTDKISAENPISPKIEETASASQPTQPSKNKQPEANKISSGYGTGSGSGIGNGRGNGDKTTPETKPSISPTPNKTTSAVKILTKPKALYTDFARFYEISGKVVLRVTFSAKGTIDSVTTVTKLPFGLTAQAIAAVRGISFEPAMRDGTAYSVTKLVEYNFTIY